MMMRCCCSVGLVLRASYRRFFEFGAGRIAFAAVRLFIWRCLNGSRRKSRSGDGRVSAVRKGGFEFKRRR